MATVSMHDDAVTVMTTVATAVTKSIVVSLNVFVSQTPPLRSISMFSPKFLQCVGPYEGVSNKVCPRVFSRCAPQLLPPGV